MKIVLVLGCWGRKHDEFQMCGGVENEILDISDSTERNIAISKHIDEVYHLFDKPMYNNVHTALFGIQENFSQAGKPVFKGELYAQLEAFCAMHSKCGLFLRLKLKEL